MNRFRCITVLGTAIFCAPLAPGQTDKVFVTPALGELTVQQAWQQPAGKDTLVYNLIERPTAQRIAPEPEESFSVMSLSPEEEAKTQIYLSVTAYVYGDISELVWSEGEDVVHRVLSSTDFSIFPSSFEFSTEDTRYAASIMVFNFGDELPADLFEATQRGAALAVLQGKGTAEYVVVADSAAIPSEENLNILDVLHSYYALNQTELRASAALRSIAAEAEAQIMEEETLAPKTITITYWREPASPPPPENEN